MPIVIHSEVEETPWREGYRWWTIANSSNCKSSYMSISLIEENSGTPLQSHASEEFIIVLEGCVEVNLKGNKSLVFQDQTIIVPINTPHSLKNLNSEPAKLLTFFPISDPFSQTKYIDGQAPKNFLSEFHH